MSFATLLLTDVKASELPAADINGLSDPYMHFIVGETKLTTSVVEKTLSPSWNDFLGEIPLTCGDVEAGVVKIECWDKDTVSSDDFLGSAEIAIKDIIFKLAKSKEPVNLELYKKSKKRGVVRFKVEVYGWNLLAWLLQNQEFVGPNLAVFAPQSKKDVPNEVVSKIAQLLITFAARTEGNSNNQCAVQVLRVFRRLLAEGSDVELFEGYQSFLDWLSKVLVHLINDSDDAVYINQVATFLRDLTKKSKVWADKLCQNELLLKFCAVYKDVELLNQLSNSEDLFFSAFDEHYFENSEVLALLAKHWNDFSAEQKNFATLFMKKITVRFPNLVNDQEQLVSHMREWNRSIESNNLTGMLRPNSFLFILDPSIAIDMALLFTIGSHWRGKVQIDGYDRETQYALDITGNVSPLEYKGTTEVFSVQSEATIHFSQEKDGIKVEIHPSMFVGTVNLGSQSMSGNVQGKDMPWELKKQD